VERRYYNVVFKAVIEDVLLRLYEQRRRSARGRRAVVATSGANEAHATAARPPYGRVAVTVGRLLTLLLELDVCLFGRIRTGPFFGLLEPMSSDERRQMGARP